MGIGAIVGAVVGGAALLGIAWAFFAGGKLVKSRQANLEAFAVSAGLSYGAGSSPLTFSSRGQRDGTDVEVEFAQQLRASRGQHLMARFRATADSPRPVLFVILARSPEASNPVPGLARHPTGDSAFDERFQTRAADPGHMKALTASMRSLLLELGDNLRGYVSLQTGPEVELVYRVGTTDEEFDPNRLRRILDAVAATARG